MREAFRISTRETAPVARSAGVEVFKLASHREYTRGHLTDLEEFFVTRDRQRPTVGRFRPGKYDVDKEKNYGAPIDVPTVRPIATDVLALGPHHALKKALRQEHRKIQSNKRAIS